MTAPRVTVLPDRVCLYLRKSEGGPTECYALDHMEALRICADIKRGVLALAPTPALLPADCAPVERGPRLGKTALLILQALMRRPHANHQLQAITGLRAGSVCSAVSALARNGLVSRIDGKAGKGNYATYAITERGVALISPERRAAA